MVTICYKDNQAQIHPDVARRLGVRDWQQIGTLEKFVEIMHAHCSYMISLSQHLIQKDVLKN